MIEVLPILGGVLGTLGAALTAYLTYKGHKATTKVEAAKVRVEERADSLESWARYAETLEEELDKLRKDLADERAKREALERAFQDLRLEFFRVTGNVPKTIPPDRTPPK